MCPQFNTFLPISVKYHSDELVGRLRDAKIENEMLTINLHKHAINEWIATAIKY